MKSFIIKLLILPLLTFLVFFLPLLLFCPQYTHIYSASFIDKMRRLESIKEPKIVLAGNSNLAFGIQSDIIETKMGMPVVNLGLHGGLGNAFHERMALFNLNKGDIVVISHLDYSDDDDILSPELALITVENYFRYWKIFRLKDYSRIISFLPKYVYDSFNRFKNKSDQYTADAYSRSAFNQYGDNVFPRPCSLDGASFSLQHYSVNSVCMDRINRFYNYCNSRGVTLVISGAPIISGLDGFDLDEYLKFHSDVEKFAKCPVISDFRDYVFDKSYFYDCAFHLTNEGARLRSQQLVKDLMNYLNRF